MTSSRSLSRLILWNWHKNANFLGFYGNDNLKKIPLILSNVVELFKKISFGFKTKNLKVYLHVGPILH